jgi:hypothetical protein
MFRTFFGRHKKPHIDNIRELIDDNFSPIASYGEAKEDPSGYAVMHGDDGGQIYLTVPLSRIKASQEELADLLRRIDAKEWNDPRTRLLYYEHGSVGQEISGGMGGGILTDGLWLHPALKTRQLDVEHALNMKS